MGAVTKVASIIPVRPLTNKQKQQEDEDKFKIF